MWEPQRNGISQTWTANNLYLHGQHQELMKLMPAGPKGWPQCFPSHLLASNLLILFSSVPNKAASSLSLFKILCIPYLRLLLLSTVFRVFWSAQIWVLGNKVISSTRVECAYKCWTMAPALFFFLISSTSKYHSFIMSFTVPEFHIWEKMRPICFCEMSLFQLARYCTNFP